MNLTLLIGNLTKDPEKVEGVQKSLCKLNLAVNANYTTADGERPTQYFNVAVWGVLAENCLKYLKKGSKIGVCGKLQTRSWEDSEGKKRYTQEIVATEIEFLTTPRKTGDMEELDDKASEDLPF